jgi:DNA polymerase III gamma/tau subunit
LAFQKAGEINGHVLANKYRPQKIADLIGQDAVVKILDPTTTLSGKHHDCLQHLAGKYGCGKTGVPARRFAASVDDKKGMTSYSLSI